MNSIDFSNPSALSDVVLVVDDRKLHCSKTILSVCSPVFAAMFKSDFKEKEESVINLTGKIYEDIYELLEVVLDLFKNDYLK